MGNENRLTLTFRCPLFVEQELDALLLDVVRATNRGVAVTRNVSSEPNWSFGQSFFFAGTVVTTIGIVFMLLLKPFLIVIPILVQATVT